MNKEKIILDFIVFILLDFEELHSDETRFFDQIQSEELLFERINFDEKKYENYIESRINISELLYDKEIEIPQINNISDILNSEEIFNIVTFLRDNYRHGFPTDFEDGLATGGNLKIEISNTEIREYFLKYLSYREINSNVFISYYCQFLNDISYLAKKQFELEKKIINEINISKELLEIRDKIDFVESKKRHYKDLLFKSVENLNFQIKGFSDDKGLFIDVDKTLVEILKYDQLIYPKSISNIIETFDTKNHLANLTKQYFELIVLNANNTELKYDSVKQKELASDLLKLKEENIDLIEYLITKKFSDSEIDIILNTLSDGHYNDLNIRNINFTQQINYFHFCYAFYIFDFFNEKRNTKFTTENSFKEILKYSNSYLGYDKNAFLKYYKNIKSDKSHSDYPFKRFDKILNEIEEKLRINTNKLKKIIV
jgi:hypothetical protein